MNKTSHSEDYIDELYISRKLGRRGIAGVDDYVIIIIIM